MPLFFTTKPGVANYMHNIFTYDVRTTLLLTRSTLFVTKTTEYTHFPILEVLNLFSESQYVLTSYLNLKKLNSQNICRIFYEEQ
jgi:hypothetical protein